MNILFVTYMYIIAVGITEAYPSLHRTHRPEQFIVGGKNSARGRWPWQVSLQAERDGGWIHTCGATLVAPQYILTAAHCVHDTSGYPLQGWFGGFNLTANDADDIVKVTSKFIHPNYRDDADGLPYDIALLGLERPVRFSSNITVATLAEPLDEFLEAECYITGWGYLSTNPIRPTPILQELEIPVYPNFNCSVSMRNVQNGAVNCGQMCVFQQQAQKASCKGDSGGPLSCRRNATSAYVVAGVSSWVVQGCSVQFPSVYTRVSYYRKWIDIVLQKEVPTSVPRVTSQQSEITVGNVTAPLTESATTAQPAITTSSNTLNTPVEIESQRVYLEAAVASKGVPFIVNGWTSVRGRWPWQVSLQTKRGSLWYHLCGASLIASSWILTAAHCVSNPTANYRAWFGAFDLSTGDFKDSVSVNNSAIIQHPGYTGGVGPKDIAVLGLTRNVDLSSSDVQIAILPNYPDEFVGTECYITGWGFLNGETKEVPRKLQEARIPVISNHECARYVRGIIDGFIDCGNICLLDEPRKIGSCSGDSGGPLSCRRNANSPWVVAGVTSWGVRDCPGNYPSVYTRTSYYRRWVEEVTGLALPTRPTPTGTPGWFPPPSTSAGFSNEEKTFTRIAYVLFVKILLGTTLNIV